MFSQESKRECGQLKRVIHQLQLENENLRQEKEREAPSNAYPHVNTVQRQQQQIKDLEEQLVNHGVAWIHRRRELTCILQWSAATNFSELGPLSITRDLIRKLHIDVPTFP